LAGRLLIAACTFAPAVWCAVSATAQEGERDGDATSRPTTDWHLSNEQHVILAMANITDRMVNASKLQDALEATPPPWTTEQLTAALREQGFPARLWELSRGQLERLGRPSILRLSSENGRGEFRICIRVRGEAAYLIGRDGMDIDEMEQMPVDELLARWDRRAIVIPAPADDAMRALWISAIGVGAGILVTAVVAFRRSKKTSSNQV
jgi:hypothetical protein